MDGVINIYKPSGITSSDAVIAIKRAFHTKAVGHMGTLDPIGCGVLLVGIGKGTRLFDYFLAKTKTYVAEFEFGRESDSLDITGKITGETSNIPTIGQINSILHKFIGKQQQIPPQFSAKSINGKRAYELARKGITAELRPSEIEINNIKCVGETAKNIFAFEIDCGSGTYIRSICRDVARELDSLALMTSIKRTRCGNFFAEDAVTLDAFAPSDIIALEDAIILPRYDAPIELYNKICNGVSIKAEGVPSGQFALYCNGELFGIAGYDDGIKIKTYLRVDKQ